MTMRKINRKNCLFHIGLILSTISFTHSQQCGENNSNTAKKCMLDPDLIAWWSFDSVVDTGPKNCKYIVFDQKAQQRNACVRGMFVLGEGNIGKAIEFNGRNTHLVAGGNTAGLLPHLKGAKRCLSGLSNVDLAISAELWLRTKEMTGIVPLIDKRTAKGGVFLFIINGFVGLELSHQKLLDADSEETRTSYDFHVSPGYIADEEWHHIAFSVDGMKRDGKRPGQIYVDGVEVLGFDVGAADLSASKKEILKIAAVGKYGGSLKMPRVNSTDDSTVDKFSGMPPLPQWGGPVRQVQKKNNSPSQRQQRNRTLTPVQRKYFKGSLDEIALYQKALSPADVLLSFRTASLKLQKDQVCTKSSCSINIPDVEMQDLSVSNNFGVSYGTHGPLAAGNYLFQVTQSGDFTIQNLSGTWNLIVAGAYQFISGSPYIGFSGYIDQNSASPGDSTTVTLKIYNVLSQLVCTGQTVVSIYQPCTPCPNGGIYDGANCYLYSVPGNTPFVYANRWYYKPLWHPDGPCPHDAYNNWNSNVLSVNFDSANCHLGPAPAGSSAFIYGENYYHTPIGSNGCSPSGGIYDGANCYVASWPGVTPFIYANNFYYSSVWHPQGPCPHNAHNNWSGDEAVAWYDGANCVVELHPGGSQTPFIWGNNYYLTPVCQP